MPACPRARWPAPAGASCSSSVRGSGASHGLCRVGMRRSAAACWICPTSSFKPAAPAASSADNAIRAIREVSHDMTGRSRVRLANGRELSALDIQREYLTRARDFAGHNGADPISKRVLEMWERALDAIETGNLDAIAREIDWVIKYQLIERYRARHDLPLSSPRVAELDLAYHDVHRSSGRAGLMGHAGKRWRRSAAQAWSGRKARTGLEASGLAWNQLCDSLLGNTNDPNMCPG